MKKIILFLLFVLCLQNCDNNEPSLYFPSSEILLGDIKLGTDKKVLIEIENKGNKPLILENVNSSCKCINIDFSRNKIFKNEKSNITMVYKADELGSHDESIVIISNDPKKFNLQKIKINVIK